MEQYIVVPQEFVLRMVGKTVGNVEFAARQDNEGRWVCAAQSAEDFKEEFKELGTPEVVNLNINDFPSTTILPQ